MSDRSDAITVPQFFRCNVPVSILQHFMHKANVMSVHAEGNAHSIDWPMSTFVNDLALSQVGSQLGQCVLNNYERDCKLVKYVIGQIHSSEMHVMHDAYRT